jgi:glycine/D-amino acid oxidase-like deaminating enzyme
MLSYWEKTQLLNYDLIVLGGGITGMFCALEYRKLNPKASIAILERGLFSNGASTKNAGFACFGSLTELIDDSKNMDNESLCKIVQMRIDGLALLRETLGDKNIDLQWKGGYELFFDKTPDALNQIDYFNELLKPIFKKNVFYWNNSKIKQFGFSEDRVKHIIENPFEGQIDTGMMMRALRSIVNEKDISFFSNVTLTDFDFSKDQNHLSLKLKNIDFNFHCNNLAICNNAFASQLFPSLKISPGRGLVILTEPIPNLRLEGTFHYQQGYYYFRNIKDRILLGGGRSVDFDAETTTSFGVNPKIKNQLIEDLQNFIFPSEKVSLDMEWSGIMAFGKDKTPIVKKHQNNIVIGVKLSGMGVAIGSEVGKKLAMLLKN